MDVRDYKDAVNYLKDSKCSQSADGIYEISHNINLDIAIESINKQIPRLTRETQELSTVEYICPSCEHINGSRFNYCWNCGQAIMRY